MYRQRNTRPYGGRRNPRFSGRGQGRATVRTFDPSSIIASLKENRSRMDAPSNGESISKEYEVKNKFSDFAVVDRLKDAILRRGYDIPTPIQDQTIPHILNGRDVVGIANTGTGKTAAFLIPLINKVLKNGNSRTLIIAPTRELAVQIESELKLLSEGLGISSVICIGGVSIRPQINRLSQKPKFVIGTPGRLLDLANQRKLDFSRFESIVLDEVDRMLDMGFITDIDKIISSLPRVRQSLFFSATLDPKVQNVMGKFIVNPVMISVKTADTSGNVEQDIIELRGRNKTDVLCDLLDQKEVTKTLIFTRTKRGADRLHKDLSRINFQVGVLHGNKSQNQRQRALTAFKKGELNVLIATDVASRGIDVRDITHVINHDLPESYDAYIHRIGRTGRADKKGVALTFVG